MHQRKNLCLGRILGQRLHNSRIRRQVSRIRILDVKLARLDIEDIDQHSHTRENLVSLDRVIEVFFYVGALPGSLSQQSISLTKPTVVQMDTWNLHKQ